jgi:Transposase IS66 family
MGTTTPSGESQATTLGQEPAALQAHNQLLRAEVVALRQQAHYHRSQHRRAGARAEELQAQVDVLKSQGRRTPATGCLVARANAPAERPFWAEAASGLAPGVSSPAEPVMAARCGKRFRWWRWSWSSATQSSAVPTAGWRGTAGVPPPASEPIEWEVRLFRRRTIRPKYRRPVGCHCQAERPEIISAPLAPALIAKGLLANSSLTGVLVLKFLYHVPLERIRAMARSAGLALSAGTLCGALQKLTPLFAPLYDAIFRPRAAKPRYV